MDYPSSEATSKTVLILGDFSIEGIEDRIRALNYTFQKHFLTLQQSDWIGLENDILKLINTKELLAIVMLLSKPGLLIFSLPEFLSSWSALLGRMKQVPSLILLDEECFQNVRIFSEIDLTIRDCLDFINDNLRLTLSCVNNVISIDELSKKDIFLIDDYSLWIMGNEVSLYKPNIKLEMTKIKQQIEYCDTFKRDMLLDIKRILTNIKSLRKNLKDYRKNIITERKLRRYLNDLLNKIVHMNKQIQIAFDEEITEQSQSIKPVLNILKESGIEIVPYNRTRTDVSLKVHHFLDEIDRGIFLQLYVPNGRYQAEQLKSFLQLFENYLQRVEKLQFFIDIKKTRHGQIYVFRSEDSISTIDDMRDAISRFESFMSLCQNNQKQAEAILISKGINSNDAYFIISKFIKEYNRVENDSRHEYERKLLELRHRLEDELLEHANGSSQPLIKSDQPSALLSFSNNSGPISISILGSSIGNNPIVEQTLNGDITYTSEDRQLIEMFQEHVEPSAAVLLKSDLELLKDNSAPEEDRKSAKQKIAGFLAKVAPAIGQSALDILTTYIEKKLMGL